MPGPRAAIDTSVVWAALAYPAHPLGRVIDLWYAGKYELVWNPETLAEYRKVLLDPDYLSRLAYDIDVTEFLEIVEICGHRAEEPKVALPPIKDLDDKKWQAAAVGGQARYLVTTDHRAFLGDPELIRAMRELGVDVVRPGIFIREIERR